MGETKAKPCPLTRPFRQSFRRSVKVAHEAEPEEIPVTEGLMAALCESHIFFVDRRNWVFPR